jgi:CHAD domain-containing protein
VVDGADALQLVAPVQPPLIRTASAPDALQTIARACITQIRSCSAGLHRRSPEALHQARVALRRWRTALTVFAALLTDQGRRLRADLDWLARELNEARDLDVFAPALEARGRSPEADREALAQLTEALEQARTRAYERAERALRSERARRVMWEGARPTAAAGHTLAGQAPAARTVVARALARRRRQLLKAGPHFAGLEASERHKLRIRAKKARYAAELFGELFSHRRRQRRFTQAMRDLQDTLGELNDVHVGRRLALELARHTGGAEAGFEAGLIAAAQQGREVRLLTQAEKAYGRLVRAGRFW